MNITVDTMWDILELVEAVKQEPEKLETLDAPDEFKAFLRTSIAVKKATGGTLDDLETEVVQLYEDINSFGDKIVEEDTDAMQAYLKLKAALIGKLVDLKERTYNMRVIKSFQDRVLYAIDTIMNPAQRTEFMEILGKK